MAEPIIIGTAGTKFIKDSDSIMFGLSQGSGTANATSLKKNNVYYKPASGKKYIILKINVVNGDSNTRYINLRYGTSVNSAAGTQIMYIKFPPNSFTNIDTYLEIPSNNYINSDSNDNDCGINNVLGVEIDN